jgi:hypothetical protein
MNSENPDWAAFIADVETKIAVLQALLTSLKSAQALGAIGQQGEVIQPSPASATTSVGNPIVTISGPMDLPAGVFLRKSLATGIELYLQTARSKKTTREIAQALKDGGVESTSGNFESVVAAKLSWLKRGGKVLKMQDGSWALAEWYPPNFRANLRPEGKPRKREKSRQRKPKTEARKVNENKENHQTIAEIKRMPVTS